MRVSEAVEGVLRPGRAVVWPASIVLWSILVLEVVASLAVNDGQLYFSLDDPYIHLALAEGIADGHFGLNPGEVSAPSSSVLWPFLWVPFADFEGVTWLVLLFNALCAQWTLLLVLRCLVLSFVPGVDGRLHGALALLGIFAIPALNLVGLVFTGMEHSLQVLAAVGLVHEVLRALRTGERRGWLMFWLVLGPAVRYENGALSAAALLWLWWGGERRAAVAGAGAVALVLGAYSSLLLYLGLTPLPTSVLAKSAAADGGLKSVLYGLHATLTSTPGLLLTLAAIALTGAAWNAQRDAGERRLAGAFAVGLGLHVLLGRVGWYNRYEIYAWAACWMVVAYVWREPIIAWLARRSLVVTALLGTAVIGVVCLEYVVGLANNVYATHNVYLQQAQLGRFAREFHRAPVAVNDIGQVAWRNDAYVLDLWGLASGEALRARTQHEDSAWMGPLAEQHDVEVAMLYDKWFPGLPEDWVRLGELHMAGIRVTPADNVVAFYATADEHVAELRAELSEFEATLPRGASFVFER